MGAVLEPHIDDGDAAFAGRAAVALQGRQAAIRLRKVKFTDVYHSCCSHRCEARCPSLHPAFRPRRPLIKRARSSLRRVRRRRTAGLEVRLWLGGPLVAWGYHWVGVNPGPPRPAVRPTSMEGTKPPSTRLGSGGAVE